MNALTFIKGLIKIKLFFFSSHLYPFLFAYFALSSLPIGFAEEKKMTEQAIFSGGCFWCMEAPFESEPGVLRVTSGYTGGKKTNPTYDEVSKGTTGHIESILVEYDPKVVKYERLLKIFWQQIDPTDAGGQFVDRGEQYRTAIFYLTDQQKTEAEKSKDEIDQSKVFSKKIATQILPAQTFYPAEDDHQDYYKKNPLRYKYYRYTSGRDQFLDKTWKNNKVNRYSNEKKEPADDTHPSINTHFPPPFTHHWKKPSPAELKNKLTNIQYKVTQEEETEPPFKNDYWDNNQEGIYVDIVSGEPLFSSTHKFDSRTGWPSFTQPLVQENIIEKIDKKFFSTRTEVRSRYADSHLGHVFDDGPLPTKRRYCINSAALRFVPKDQLTQQGYEKLKPIFDKKKSP